MLRGGGVLKCDWVIEMLLYLSLKMGMLKFDWDVEILLYLSPEMESVVFVQIFFSIIHIYICILLQSVIDIYWYKVLCGNVNNMNGTCYYIFILVQYIHLCQCIPTLPINGIYMKHGTWNKICCVNAHLPINGTCCFPAHKWIHIYCHKVD